VKGASTEIPNAVFAEGRKSKMVCFGVCTSSEAFDYVEFGITAISTSNGLRYRRTVNRVSFKTVFQLK
jgi:hypothetical protein